MADKNQTFGDFLRETRLAAGLTLRGFAEKITSAPSYVSDIENDRRMPAEEVLRRMAKVLRVDFEDLVARAGRIGDEAERVVRRSPEAVRLFRMTPELHEDDLRDLRKRAEELAKKRKE